MDAEGQHIWEGVIGLPEIEGLQFKITGSATGARNSLQSTIDKLEQLKTKLSETKAEVSSLSKAMSGLGNNTGFSRFNENLKKLNASRSLGTLVKNLKAVQSEMQGIGENIGAGLVKGIAANSGQLSGIAKQYLVDPIVEAVRAGFEVHSPSRVMLEIGKFLSEGLAKGITSAATAPVRAMQSVVSKVSAAAKSAVDKGVGGEALYKGYSGVAKAASGVKNRLSGALNGGAYSDRLGGAPLQGIHNAADTVLTKTTSGVKALPGIFSHAKTATASSSKAVEQHTQKQKGLNVQLGKAKTLLNGVGTGAKQTASAMGRLAAAPVKKLLSPLSAVQDKLKHIKYALLTVVTYGSIYRIISLFKTGLTDGLNNLYQYSLITGNQFAASMDRAATSLLYLKNSIGAAAAPLINALAPALDFVVDKVVTLLNRFNQLVSALSGKTTYTKAIKQQTKYAEAVKDDADAADDAKRANDALKRSLTSFDEIHALDDNSSKDSSSSKKNPSGTEIPDYGGMFTEENIDGGIADFAKSLKDTIAKGDWQGLGKMLADKVNSTIDAIDWQGAGKKFGYGLNGIIQTAYYFLKYTDFVKIGNRFAQFLNAALRQVDFSIAGALMVREFTALLDLLGGFLGELDWGLVTKSISDFWIGYFNEITSWLDQYDWNQIGKIFAQKLHDAIVNMDVSGIANAIRQAFSTGIKSALDFASGFDEIATKYDQLGDHSLKMAENVVKAFGMIAGAMVVIKTIKTVTSILSPVISMLGAVPGLITTIVGAVNPVTITITAVALILTDLWRTSEGFRNTVIEVGKVLGSSIMDCLADLKDHFAWLLPKLQNLYEHVKPLLDLLARLAVIVGGTLLNAGIHFITGFLDIAIDVLGLLADAICGVIDWFSGLGSTISQLPKMASDGFGKFKDIWANQIENVKKSWSDGWKNIKTSTSDTLNSLKDTAAKKLSEMAANAAAKFGDIYRSAKDKFSGVKDTASDMFGKAKDAVSRKLEDMKNAVRSAIDKIKNFFNITLGFKGIKLPSISVSWDTASAVGQALSKLGMPGVPNFHVNWNQYAKGGFPDEGELYIARENGSEMIGRMGNKNVVANNQQIIDGITRGVASANSQQNALLREQNELLRALLEKDTGISIGDITNAARRQNQRMGKTVIPVG